MSVTSGHDMTWHGQVLQLYISSSYHRLGYNDSEVRFATLTQRNSALSRGRQMKFGVAIVYIISFNIAEYQMRSACHISQNSLIIERYFCIFLTLLQLIHHKSVYIAMSHLIFSFFLSLFPSQCLSLSRSVSPILYLVNLLLNGLASRSLCK